MCVKGVSKSESAKAVKSAAPPSSVASASISPTVVPIRRTSRRVLGAVMTRNGDKRSSSSQKRGSTKASSSSSSSCSTASVAEEQVGVVVCPDPHGEQESSGSGSPTTTRTTTTSSCPTPRAAKSSSNSLFESKVVKTTLASPSADAGASISSETCGTSSPLSSKRVCQENEPSQDADLKKRCSSNPDETGNRASNTVKHTPKRACLVKTIQAPMVTGGLKAEEHQEQEDKNKEKEEALEETAKKKEIIGGSKAQTRRALLTPPPPSMVVEVTTESGGRLREPRRIGEHVEENDDGQSRNLAPVVTLASSGELLGDSSGVVVSCVSDIGGPLEQQQRNKVPKVPVKSEQDLVDSAANGLPDDRKRHLIGDEFYNKATGDPANSSSTDPLGLSLNEAGPQGAQNVVVGLPVDLGGSLPSLVSADDLECPSGTAAIIYEAGGSIVSQAPVSLVLSEGLIKRDTILTSHSSSIGDAGVILYSHSQALDTPISLVSHSNSHHPHHHNHHLQHQQHSHHLEEHAHHPQHHAQHSTTDKLTAATITLYSTEDLPNTTVVTSGGSNGGGVTGAGSLVPVSLSSGDHHGGFDGGVSVGVSTGVNTSGTGTLTDMASLLAQAVKNEPEDLTGHRRDSDNEHDISHLKEAKLESSSPVGLTSHTLSNSPVVVLSSADLVNNQFPTIVTSPGDGQPTSYPSPSDLFESSSRSIYATSEPYRTSGQPGDDLYQGGFVHSRASTDVQFVEYYRTNGSQPPPPGAPHINSPDSGIGDPNIAKMFVDGHPPPSDVSHPGFEHYPHSDLLNDIGGGGGPGSVGSINGGRKSWQDYGRQSEEKIHIPKLFTPYGFKYILEAPSSSSVRREDDKITYVNKGQFYPVCLEYTPDPELPPLKSATVKSIIMLVFREGKTIEEEMKAWQFWHARQHSVKQRILDVDTKNSLGLTGCIEEISHNALAVYWNPMECQAKVNIAVQCLSTDFSTQKGVKGLPLHLQIDTFDDPRDNVGMPVYHRGYCQIKVFCDKGAERKARDEERRANKRRLTNTGKRRLDEMYHTQCDRSEFYSMADLNRGPVLFNPPDDPDKAGIEFGTEVPGFYNSRPSPPESLLKLNGSGDSVSSDPVSPQLAKQEILATISPGPAPRVPWSGLQGQNHTLLQPPPEKRIKLIPPTSERVMIYIKQETEVAFTPLHLVPPNVPGLIRAIESKYKINAANIRCLYRKTKGGILAKIDDEMLKYYSNEDSFLMQVMVTEGAGGEDTMIYDITLTEC